MKIDRRAFFKFAAVATSAMTLAACGAYTSGGASQVVTDIGLIATGLQGALPGLTGAGVPAAVVSKVSGYVTELQTLASNVTASLSQTADQPTVQKIAGVLSQIAAVAGPQLPPPWGTAIAAAQVLMPVIMLAVGLASGAPPAPAASAMTPDQARLILAGMSRK